MQTTFMQVANNLELENDLWPIDLGVFPNHMGINLCCVEGISWTRQNDGQLVSMTVHFIPNPDGDPRGKLQEGEIKKVYEIVDEATGEVKKAMGIFDKATGKPRPKPTPPLDTSKGFKKLKPPCCN